MSARVARSDPGGISHRNKGVRESAEIELGTAAGLYQSVFGLLVIFAVNFIIKRIEPEYALF